MRVVCDARGGAQARQLFADDAGQARRACFSGAPPVVAVQHGAAEVGPRRSAAGGQHLEQELVFLLLAVPLRHRVRRPVANLARHWRRRRARHPQASPRGRPGRDAHAGGERALLGSRRRPARRTQYGTAGGSVPPAHVPSVCPESECRATLRPMLRTVHAVLQSTKPGFWRVAAARVLAARCMQGPSAKSSAIQAANRANLVEGGGAARINCGLLRRGIVRSRASGRQSGTGPRHAA